MNSAHRTFALTAVTAAALALCVGTANGAPASAPTDSPQPGSVTVEMAPGFDYHDDLGRTTTSLATSFGTVTVDAGRLDITDAAGHTAAGNPVSATSPSSTVGSASEGPPSSEVSAYAGPGRLDDMGRGTPRPYPRRRLVVGCRGNPSRQQIRLWARPWRSGQLSAP
jgi:hypothetical protein